VFDSQLQIYVTLNSGKEVGSAVTYFKVLLQPLDELRKMMIKVSQNICPPSRELNPRFWNTKKDYQPLHCNVCRNWFSHNFTTLTMCISVSVYKDLERGCRGLF